MVRRIFASKLFILFASLFIIGFFVGYDYAHITYEPDDTGYLNKSTDIYSQIEKNNASQPENDDMNFSVQNNISNEEDSSIIAPESGDNADAALQNYVNQDNENSEKPSETINPSGDSSVDISELSN